MRYPAATTLIVAVLVSLLAGCQQTIGPDGMLVGFGPVVDSQPTGYCDPGSPILGYETCRRILDTPVPRLKETPKADAGQTPADEAKALACLARAVAEVAPGTLLVVDSRSLQQEAGLSFQGFPQITPGMTIEMALRGCYSGDATAMGFRLVHGRLAVLPRERVNQDLPVAMYPVSDLIRRARYGGSGEVSEDRRLQELIERTVRSSEPWESMGGRAAFNLYESKGLIIVSQTPEGHMQVARLLASLRVLGLLHRPK